MDWINYDEEPSADDASHWSSGTFHKYWYDQFAKNHGRKPRWGVKEFTLLQKLMREYKAAELKRMMELAAFEGTQFNVFYMNAPKYHDAIKGWEWN